METTRYNEQVYVLTGAELGRRAIDRSGPQDRVRRKRWSKREGCSKQTTLILRDIYSYTELEADCIAVLYKESLNYAKAS